MDERIRKSQIDAKINKLLRPEGVSEGNFAHAHGLLAILEEAERYKRENLGIKDIIAATQAIIENYPERIRQHIQKGDLPKEAKFYY